MLEALVIACIIALAVYCLVRGANMVFPQAFPPGVIVDTLRRANPFFDRRSVRPSIRSVATVVSRQHGVSAAQLSDSLRSTGLAMQRLKPALEDFAQAAEAIKATRPYPSQSELRDTVAGRSTGETQPNQSLAENMQGQRLVGLDDSVDDTKRAVATRVEAAGASCAEVDTALMREGVTRVVDKRGRPSFRLHGRIVSREVALVSR